MSTGRADLDPHAKVPQELRTIFKRYQRLKGQALDTDREVFDLGKDASNDQKQRLRQVEFQEPEVMRRVFQRFEPGAVQEDVERRLEFEFADVPGKRTLKNGSLLYRHFHSSISQINIMHLIAFQVSTLFHPSFRLEFNGLFSRIFSIAIYPTVNTRPMSTYITTSPFPPMTCHSSLCQLINHRHRHSSRPKIPTHTRTSRYRHI